jgi:O-antigen/teichoic acid export membrane protein
MNAEPATPEHDLGGFFGRDLVYVILWAAQIGLATLLTPVETRLLGAASYGLAATCVTLMQLLVAVGAFGLQMAVQRVYARNGDDAARQVVTLSLVAAALCFLLVSVTGPLWAPALQFGSYSGTVFYAVTWAGLSAVTATTLGLLRSRDQLGRFALVSLMQTTVAEALSLALVVFVARTAKEYILGEMIGQAATLAVALCLVRPVRLRRSDWAASIRVLRFSAPLVSAAVATFVLSTSDRLVVNADRGHIAAGRYAVANSIGSILVMLTYALSESWLPRILSIADRERIGTALAQSRNALYALLIPLIVGMSATSPLLLRLWAPHSYNPDGLQLVVALTVITALPYAGTTTSTRILILKGQSRPAAQGTAIAAAVNLALNLALVPVLGIVGSAAATIVGYCVMHLLLARSARSLLRLPPLGRRLWTELSVAVVAVFAVLVIPVSTPFMVARGACGVACGVAALLMVLALRSQPGQRRPKLVGAWLDAHTEAR